MNIFLIFFVSLLCYPIFFFSTVNCQLSDKRRCANADCSEPISYARSLIQYFGNHEGMLSFPPNVKLKVFSKEAGNNPSLWEVEMYGKRGYVPKGFLREEKVLIPSNKLTHIVPTGKINSPKLNTTSKTSKEQESNSINQFSATPELPVKNSKGLFSTIGGVSAESVPKNSPDIKPQSTRKFEILEGTTLYDDVVSETPESPPTIVDDDAGNKKQESDKDTPDSREVPHDSNVPSSIIKPVTEEIDENIQTIEAERKMQDKDKITEKVKDIENSSEDKEGQPLEGAAEAQSETIFGTLVNKVTNFISSGAGENMEDELDVGVEEEGEEEGEEEEEEYDEEEEEEEVGEEEEEGADGEHSVKKEEKNKAEEIFERNSGNEPEELPQPEGQPGEISHINTSEATSFMNTVFENSSGLKSDDAMHSGEYNRASQEDKKLPDTKIDVESNEKVTEESMKSSNDSESNLDSDSKVDTKSTVPSKFEGKADILSQPIEAKIPKTDLTEGSNLNINDINQSSVVQIFEGVSNDIYKKSPEQVPIEDLKKTTGEVKNEGEKESTIDPTSDKLAETPKAQEKSDNEESQVDKKPEVDKLQASEQLITDEAQDQEHTSEVDDSQVQKKPKSDELQNHEKPKIDEPQVQEPPQTDESKFDEHSEVIAQSSTLQPTRQFLYGSGQLNVGIPESNRDETSDTSSTPEPPLDSIKSQADSVNDTSHLNLPPHSPHSTPSSFPTTESIQSPKYSSVVSRRIQSSGTSSVHDILSHSEVEEDSEEQLSEDNTLGTSESTPIHEETLPPNLYLQSQSPKYSKVVSSQIGSVTPSDNLKSETMPETETEAQPTYTESGDVTTTEEQLPEISSVETVSQAEQETPEEIENKEGIVLESRQVPLEDSQPSTVPDDVSTTEVVYEPVVETAPEKGIFSWVPTFHNIFGSDESSSIGESPAITEDLDSPSITHSIEETCSADGVEGSCPMLKDTTRQQVTWQEASYTSDMWELLDRVPLEATVWLIITAVVVLIFSLGHYYIEAHRRDGPLVAIINKFERDVLILKKERCILEDRLLIAEQQLDVWNTSSTENDALLVEIKQELEETKAAKAELEEQAVQLKEELESATESGLEMHRLLEESLSSQDGSQVLLSTVETLREKLQRQEEEISGLSDTLSSKNAEVEELQGRLAHSAEVARSLEDKVIFVTREKEDELLQLRDKHRELISQLEEVMETKALDETRLSTEMSKLRLIIEELQKTLAEKDSELDTLKEVVKQLRATDSNEKIEALFDVVSVQAKLRTAVSERDDFREKFLEEEGARKLLEGHMKKITQEVAELKNSFETAEKEKIEALTKLQVLSNYFKEKESQLQKELGLQESMWLQKQSDDHTIYEQMRSLREENEKYKLQNESLKKEIVEQEASFKIQLANTEQKAHENWVASRQAERKVKEAQQEAAQLRNRLTTVEKNSANYSLDEKPNISESNGDPSSPPPSLMFPPTTSPPFMMYGPPIPPPGDFVPPPPLMGSPYPSDSRPPPLGRISSPPLDHRFSPPPPLPYSPYDYPTYGHHSPSPPPPLPPHHRNVHKPQPREMSREQKDHVPHYSPEAEKTLRRKKR